MVTLAYHVTGIVKFFILNYLKKVTVSFKAERRCILEFALIIFEVYM